jgi:adenylate cyclase
VGIEIERKFLLRDAAWRNATHRSAAMRQGSLAGGGNVSVRVRIAGNEARLNLKSGGMVVVRREYEYAIPLADATELLDEVCPGPLVEKTRHWVEHEGYEWEVDEFTSANAGLVVAEIELDDEHEAFPRPSWLGAEVTHLERYYNASLVKYPYREWSEAERPAADAAV